MPMNGLPLPTSKVPTLEVGTLEVEEKNDKFRVKTSRH